MPFSSQTKYFGLSKLDFTEAEFFEIFETTKVKHANIELNQFYKNELERFKQLRFQLDKFNFEDYHKLMLGEYVNL